MTGYFSALRSSPITHSQFTNRITLPTDWSSLWFIFSVRLMRLIQLRNAVDFERFSPIQRYCVVRCMDGVKTSWIQQIQQSRLVTSRLTVNLQPSGLSHISKGYPQHRDMHNLSAGRTLTAAVQSIVFKPCWACMTQHVSSAALAICRLLGCKTVSAPVFRFQLRGDGRNSCARTSKSTHARRVPAAVCMAKVHSHTVSLHLHSYNSLPHITAGMWLRPLVQ